MSNFLPEGTRGKGVPQWADEYSTQLFRELVDEVDRDMAARGIPYRMDLEAGVLSFTPPGLPPQEYQLRMFADRCRWKERGAWADHIRDTMDRVIRARIVDAITFDQLAADWNLAAEWLRVHFDRAWKVKERSDRVWWEVATGLTAVLEYGLPHRKRPVPLEHVRGWGQPRDELFRMAVQNVRNWPKLPCKRVDRPDWGPVEFYGPERLHYDDWGTEEFYRVDHANHYPASHLLFLEDYLDPVPPAGVVLAVPTDSEFGVYLMTGRANEAFLRKLARVVPEFYMEAYCGVSPFLYWWRDGVITPLFSGEPGKDAEFWLPPEFRAVLKELADQGG